MPSGIWQGWLEFDPQQRGQPLRSQRETTQPNRTDTLYWAGGLTPVYLEGALRRALRGPLRVPIQRVRQPVFGKPGAGVTPQTVAWRPTRSVLDPFSVYRKGELPLRQQLGALWAPHLVKIVLEYELSSEAVETLDALPAAALIELIIGAVRRQTAGAYGSLGDVRR